MDQSKVEFLESLGIEATTDNIQHLGVLLWALQLYNERSKKHGQAWRRYGALNNLVRLATKCERLVSLFWRNENHRVDPDLDDAYDAINYAVFFIRQAQTGDWFDDGVS